MTVQLRAYIIGLRVEAKGRNITNRCNMDFTSISGKAAKERCVKGGKALYCECGCQKPRESDTFNLDGLTARRVKNSQEYIALIRDGEIVGEIAPGYNYVALDGNEYKGVTKGARLASLFDLSVNPLDDKPKAKAPKKPVIFESAGGAGWCNACQSYCWGDCSASED